MSYAQFLESKVLNHQPSGFDVGELTHAKYLANWQMAIVNWCLKKGRAAMFEDTGLGKTRQQLAWADEVCYWEPHSRAIKDPYNVLILAPLAVAHQTIAEADLMGITVRYARSQDEVKPGITIANYEMLSAFDHSKFIGVVLDESSILKSYMGKTKQALIDAFAQTPYRLCCTATPSPNDTVELGNHAEFLGVMDAPEMLTRWFINDTTEAQTFRLKAHGERDFWRWVASWAICIGKPSDLPNPDGEPYSDEGYILPKLHIHTHVVKVDQSQGADGQLFRNVGMSATSMHREMRATADDRAAQVAHIVSCVPNEPWVIWCNTDYEADAVTKALKLRNIQIAEVAGSDLIDHKVQTLTGFSTGQISRLLTKPKIAGFGLNWQHCANTVFMGLSHCYDQDTELLTQRGWLRFCDVTKDDWVATVNPETQLFEWQQPSEVIWQWYSGEMLHFKCKSSFDLCVTPNHNLFVCQDPKRYPASKGNWFLKQATDISENYKRQQYCMMTATKGFVGSKPESIHIPLAVNRRINSRSRIVREIPTRDFMRLVGWYLSEGHCRPLNTPHAGRIVICQSDKHPENRAEIINLLQGLGLHVNSRTKDITASSINLASFLLREFGSNSYEKRIPLWVKNLDTELLIILRDTMLKGDGCHNNLKPVAYRTFSLQLQDDFQEICLKTGVRASVKPNWGGTRYAAQNVEPSISSPPKKVQYEGYIGCVTVPNHTVIVRRNGYAVVSGNSYEQFYQALRRFYRFGQLREVNAHLVIAETELPILGNIQRKKEEHERMKTQMVEAMREFSELGNLRLEVGPGAIKTERGENWTMHHGDCCEVVQGIASDSIGFSIFSPPFSNLYSYSPSLRDMGNTADDKEFFEHFGYLIPELLRVTIPGRLCAVHVKNLPIYKSHEGYTGIRDFRGETIRAFTDQVQPDGTRWSYHSEVCIWTDPVREMQRTKAQGLLYSQLKRDGSHSRQGMAEYLLLFRKWTPACDAPQPVTHTDVELPLDLWQNLASPVWMDIRRTDVLNVQIARDDQDEKHLAPLQLEVIRRVLKLWTNPGDLVLSPFAGVGSEGYVAVEQARKFVGVELKDSYYRLAVKHLKEIESKTGNMLFDLAEVGA